MSGEETYFSSAHLAAAFELILRTHFKDGYHGFIDIAFRPFTERRRTGSADRIGWFVDSRRVAAADPRSWPGCRRVAVP